ncbi:hypothetical protein EJ05DRAFT_501753 [Pseudovirgaria hyperparasitica]|uniref:Uncharacterized protein n=1 Tax=Pseudovirgaria hyperparasitica TaxID=470096 RepID=A0A6A6W816_9PEZI|nr:uncharacterized protein EJ05DRAFT_501753 [Pseudovirgaria hyperparasitica]KAF2757221.1 hypothetical protein EJ05DRAFT_501753 [Pseudovirgaria hyperparasitica]
MRKTIPVPVPVPVPVVAGGGSGSGNDSTTTMLDFRYTACTGIAARLAHGVTMCEAWNGHDDDDDDDDGGGDADADADGGETTTRSRARKTRRRRTDGYKTIWRRELDAALRPFFIFNAVHFPELKGCAFLRRGGGGDG